MQNVSRLTPAAPPVTVNDRGETRKVGVELEFAGLSAREAAAVVARKFGGVMAMEDPHRFRVATPSRGDFVVELDFVSAHPEGDDEMEGRLAEWIGDISQAVVPMEIVAPPIAYTDIGILDALVVELDRHGAAGSQTGLLSAFGLHLNPEAARLDLAWILDVFKAYLVLSEWLRREIGVNFRRRITSFIDPFPADYVRRVVDPRYQPGLADFMDDYLAANPTRNRELDLLPLFAHLDPDRVRAAVPDPRVKARPTFHYRLPDSRVGELWWSVTAEWNRWVVVERLAADPERLAAAGRAYMDHLDRLFSHGWPDMVERWLDRG